MTDLPATSVGPDPLCEKCGGKGQVEITDGTNTQWKMWRECECLKTARERLHKEVHEAAQQGFRGT